VSRRPQLTTEAGAPVADNQHSQTVGPNGPVLLQDHHLLEKLARFNRERIPERVVHAVGSGAYGSLVVTNPDVARWTRMKLSLPPHQGGEADAGPGAGQLLRGRGAGGAQPGQLRASNPAQNMTFDADLVTLARTAFQNAGAGDSTHLAWMLDAGLPVNLRNERGDTLLMLASYHGQLDTVRLLLTRGANPEQANDQGQTPLAGVAFKGNVAMAELLLQHGARVDGAGADGRTPLMFAAMFDRLEVLELLLARGAKWDSVDSARHKARDYALMMSAHRARARLEQAQQAARRQEA